MRLHQTGNKSVCGFLDRCGSASNDAARLSMFVVLKRDVSLVLFLQPRY